MIMKIIIRKLHILFSSCVCMCVCVCARARARVFVCMRVYMRIACAYVAWNLVS